MDINIMNINPKQKIILHCIQGRNGTFYKYGQGIPKDIEYLLIYMILISFILLSCALYPKYSLNIIKLYFLDNSGVDIFTRKKKLFDPMFFFFKRNK